jgi:hypothetical protein
MERKRYVMTEEDLAALLEACRRVPLIALQCGTPRSPQEQANDAWRRLGAKMGFKPMTVRPVPGAGQRVFTAEPASGREEGEPPP